MVGGRTVARVAGGVIMVPLQRLLLRDLVSLVVVASMGLTAVGYWGYERAIDDDAHAWAEGSLLRMGDLLKARLRRHEQAVDEVGKLWAIANSKANGDLDREAFAATLVVLAPPDESFRSLGIVRADGFAVDVAPVTGGYETESCTHHASIGVCSAQFWSPARTPMPPFGSHSEGRRNDPREREWYAGALARSNGAWGVPYVHEVDGALINRFRMTYAVSLATENGLASVAECALSLDTLLMDVRAMQPSSATLTFITDRDRRAVLLPPLPEFRGAEATPNGRAIGPAFLPIAASVLEAGAHGGHVSIDGENYYVARRTFDTESDIHWVMSMALPERELLVNSRRVAIATALLAGVTVALFIWRAVFLARRFGGPIRALAQATQASSGGGEFRPPESDISEIAVLSERFRESANAVAARAKLEAEMRHIQRVATLGTLAGGIAHDVNNQLTTLLSGLELAQRGRGADENLVLARHAAMSCVELTKGLLAFSRGGHDITLLPMDVAEVAGRAAQLVGGTFRSANVTLRTDFDPGLPRPLGDKVLFEQVIVNLLVNAKDAMPEGGTVTVAARRSRIGFVEVAVTDTGVGVSAQNRERVFDAFYTTKEPDKGTGLGLSIVQGIVVAHGGRVELESVVGVGSTFTVILPTESRGRASGPAPA